MAQARKPATKTSFQSTRSGRGVCAQSLLLPVWLVAFHQQSVAGGRPVLTRTLAASALHSTRCLARELRRRLQSDRPSSRFEPCLPRPVQHPPAGPGWIHEIKHDGFRILAHRRGRSIRLVTRNGYDFADRFPLVTAAIEELPVKSCIIDGEAIVCDETMISVVATDAIMNPDPHRASAVTLRCWSHESNSKHPAKGRRENSNRQQCRMTGHVMPVAGDMLPAR